jgi:hypothetical protein
MRHFPFTLWVILVASLWANFRTRQAPICFDTSNSISTADTAGTAVHIADLVACVNLIRQELGIQYEFLVKADTIYNGQASWSPDGQPVLTFNLHFLRAANFICGTPDATVSIIAHEMGHIYYGHQYQGDRHQEELQADYFSGFVMRRLGRPVQAATIAIELLTDEAGSKTHPCKQKRMQAIEAGWRDAVHE